MPYAGRVVTLIVFFAFRAAWARCRTALGQTKTPTAKTCCRGQSQRLCGATPLDTASLPRPLIDCQHSQASYASFTSSATRHLSPRPSGAHIIGFGPCRHHTIADSLSVRLPFSSRQRFVKLSLSYHRIFALSTDFDPLSQFFAPCGASTCARCIHARALARVCARFNVVGILTHPTRIVPLPGAIITAGHRMQATRVSTFCLEIRPPQRA